MKYLKYSEFGVKVRTKLLQEGKTMTWLAKQLNISNAYVSEILKGTRTPEKKIKEIKQLLDLAN